MNIYSITLLKENSSLDLVYIVKAENSSSALAFLSDHLHDIIQSYGYRLGFVFFERSYDLTLFDSFDPEILEILSRRLYNLKYL